MENLEKGLISQESFDSKKPPRKETDEKTQRPVSTTETYNTDRGSFPSKC